MTVRLIQRRAHGVERFLADTRAMRKVVLLGRSSHDARVADIMTAEVITTDSVPQASGEKVHGCGIAPLMAEAIRRIAGGQSVTSLFEVG